jgi:hypothetical protein
VDVDIAIADVDCDAGSREIETFVADFAILFADIAIRGVDSGLAAAERSGVTVVTNRRNREQIPHRTFLNERPLPVPSVSRGVAYA